MIMLYESRKLESCLSRAAFKRRCGVEARGDLFVGDDHALAGSVGVQSP